MREKFSPIPFKHYTTPTSGYKEAGVLAILVPKEDQWNLVFMERTSNHPDDKHAGQISFPGGKKEKEETTLECALRETNEEIGVASQELEILGPLSELYIAVSNFLVYPFLAIAKKPLDYTPEIEEVKSIIETPISHLLNPKTIKSKDIHIGTRTLKAVPYFDLHGKTLWGATAIITSEILALLKKSGLEEF